jgi:hypothetical protein
VGEVERTVAALDDAIKREFPRVKRIFVEAESPAQRGAHAEP